MPWINRPREWESQPQALVPVSEKWLAKGLVALLDEHGRNLVDDNLRLSYPAGFSHRATNKGLGKSNGGTAIATASGQLQNLITPNASAFTVLGVVAPNSTGQSNKYLAQAYHSSLLVQTALIYGYVANTVEFFSNAYTGTDPRVGSGLVVSDTDGHAFCYAYDGTTWSGALDGEQVFSVARSFSINTSSTDGILGGALGGTNIIDVSTLLWAVFDRGISADDQRALTANPSQLYKAPDDRIWVPVSAGNTLTAISASFSVAGQSTALKAVRRLSAQAATFALTGNVAALKRGYTLPVTQASYAITGNATGLKAAPRLSIATSSFALTGNNATLTYSPLAKILTATVGSYVLTGNSAALRIDRRLTANAGSYAVTGQATGLKAVRRMTAAVGSYALTGVDVGLTKTGQRTLAAATATFSLTGVSTSLRAARILAAQSGQIVLTGNAAQLARGYALAATTGAFSITGRDVAFQRGLRLAADAGAYALTGYAVTLAYSASVTYARAPRGSGYQSQSFENQTRPSSGSQSRPANTQRNNR